MTDPNGGGRSLRRPSLLQQIVGGLLAAGAAYKLIHEPGLEHGWHVLALVAVIGFGVSVMFIDITRVQDWALSMIKAWKGN